ncbi:putative esterase/lipase, partial [Stagonosporopsis vannaccii]
MSTDKTPTLVLVPGSFLPSTHYTPLLAHLPPGTKSHILDPPSYHTKRPGPPPTMADDASFVASFVRNLADAGDEVVLVAHSYGGMPASECMAGLSVESRRKEGKRGGVRRLAYVTAVVPKVGEGLAETMLGGVQVPLEADE